MDKPAIHAEVKSIVNQKLERIQQLITETRASNSETKSSMGDKYETGREMLQQEINKLQIQANHLHEMLQILNKIMVNEHTNIQHGSLVLTNHAMYYISVSAGELMHQEAKIFAVSAQSPVAKLLLGRKAGDTIKIAGTIQQILEVY